MPTFHKCAAGRFVNFACLKRITIFNLYLGADIVKETCATEELPQYITLLSCNISQKGDGVKQNLTKDTLKLPDRHVICYQTAMSGKILKTKLFSLGFCFNDLML